MIRYVLDTNTLIYFFKGQGQIVQNLLAQSPTEIGIPAIVLFELQVGIAKSSSPQKRTEQLNLLLTKTAILPFGEREAYQAAQLRAHLETQGTPIGQYDTLIAGTALAHRAILVSPNVHEFSRVPSLQIVSWY